jgi:hypothetical protein
MTDGRYMQYSKRNGHDDDVAIRKGYTPDFFLALVAEYHFQPYHIGFYGEGVPIQYNEYLFASDTVLSQTCRRVVPDAEDQS